MMDVPEFAIPFNFEDFASSGQFLATDLFDLNELHQKICQAKTAVHNEGLEFIANHFSTFFSFLKKFKQLSKPLRNEGLSVIRKAFSRMSSLLSVLLDGNMETEIRQSTCNLVKMTSYILIEVAIHFQNASTDLTSLDVGKGKKKPQDTEWSDDKHNILVDIFNFWQLPIQMLWDPPVVEEEFVSLFANFCYKCLEDNSITGVTLKPVRASIFQILYTLISNHLHGLSFCVKVVQLLRTNESLSNVMAQGVVDIVNAGCNSVIREIIREILESDEQFLSDSAGSRSVSLFLVAIAESVPEAIEPNVNMLLDFLDWEPQALRCSVLSVLGEIIVASLTKEDLDHSKKNCRDSYLDVIEEHIHDVNAFVRVRSLVTWQKLCTSKAIPVSRFVDIMELIIGRLNDKAALVRKQAVQTVKMFLQCNPYSGTLNIEEITTLLNEEKKKLSKLKEKHNLNAENWEEEWSNLEPKLIKELNSKIEANFSSPSEDLIFEKAIKEISENLHSGDIARAVLMFNQLRSQFYSELGCSEEDDEDVVIQSLRKIWEQWKVPREIPDVGGDILEHLELLKKGVDYLESTLAFAKLIDRALPLIRNFLNSSVASDVMEAINFFTAAYQFKFPSALSGVRHMLELVYSKEASIKEAICSSYRTLYFDSDLTGRPHIVKAVKNLSDLVLSLNFCQIAAMEEVISVWLKTQCIDCNAFIQVLFERFSLKIRGTTKPESRAALALICMVGAEKPSIIRSNVSVLVTEGFGPRGMQDMILAECTCRALQKLQKINSSNSVEDEVLPFLKHILLNGLWSKDPHYIRFADEAVNLIFMIAKSPDKFMESLIIDLYNRIKNNQHPVARKCQGRLLAEEINADGEVFDDEVEDATQNNEMEQHEREEIDRELEYNEPAAAIMRITRFLTLLGTTAAHYMNFVENKVLGELKRRNAIDFEKKLRRIPELELEIEKESLEFQRAAQDDLNSMKITKLLENEVVEGNGLLAKFLPFILNICKSPGKFPSKSLQKAAMIALGMYMQVSSKCCDKNMQLLMTITEKSPNVDMRRNGLLLLWAIQYRFPNILKPWTDHMFALLKDSNAIVRRTAVITLTNLIVNEMVKARSYFVDLAVCLVDEDREVIKSTRHFFREYSQKGTALFHVLPSLPAVLTEPPHSLSEEQFRLVMSFLIDLCKDKPQELLVEKFCQYFECTISDRQGRDLAYCLSLLHISEKSLKKILENFRFFGNKLYIAEVYETFTNIVTQSQRGILKDKTVVTELQTLIDEYRSKSCSDRNIPVIIPKKCPASVKKRSVRKKLLSSESEGENGEVDEKPRSVRSKGGRLPKMKILSDSEEEMFAPRSSVANSTKKKQKKSDVSFECDSARKMPRTARKPSTASKARQKIILENQNEQEEIPTTRSTRKRRL